MEDGPSRHPLIPPRKVDPKQDLPALELQVLERWRERDVFAQSLRRRQGAPRWVFYEGPPTANGPPGSHHVLSRVFKDVYPRYHTMRGRLVARKGGWDCHGLPVEIAVEQKLGITSKSQIEDPARGGIEEFNRQCRESVFDYLQEWNRLTERIGFWIDLDDAYRTLDETYIESVWWALSEIDRQGLLYEGHKVVPYCYRCGTALSSHEVALGYEDVVDRSVYVKLPVHSPVGPLQDGDALLIWTTTPWTLPGNVAVAVGPDVLYARVRYRDETLILANALIERVLGEKFLLGFKERPVGEWRIEGERFRGSELLGGSYRGPIFNTGQPGGFPIVAGDFVTTEDGTGIVHIAPAFGEDDFRVAAAAPEVRFDQDDPHSLFNPVRPDGTFDRRVRSYEGREYEGRVVKDPDVTEDLIEDLRVRGLLLREEPYEHSYPHCWRCGTPLIYYAKKSWYIRTTAVRERMLAANETVGWHPPHIKHGRFGDWLANNVDWALSRERYWGTPLPVWRCGRGHTHTVGSFAELQRLSGKKLADHHRPYVDQVTFPCAYVGGEESPSGIAPCGLPMERVPEVIDVWFDSGAMPFAQHHVPFSEANPEAGISQANPTAGVSEANPTAGVSEANLTAGVRATEDPATQAVRFTSDAARFPADFICEALDQTRGWFYSLLAVSTLLFGEAPYRNVVCLGLILDAEGQKMSKSKGNTVEPWQVLDSYGADAFRWYFFTSKQPWDGYRFSLEAIAEGVRLFFKQLWSTYYFYCLYAQAAADELADTPADGVPAGAPADGEPADAPANGEPADDLDRWALSRTAGTAELVAERLDAYDVTGAGRAIANLVEELSNWYVRRSRRRFWDGERAAFATLRTCLLAVAKMLAPLCPFVADEIYDNLDGALQSVHLCDFPTAAEIGERDEELERAMALARETVRLGLGARGKAKIKVRQPLREAAVVAAGREREAIERLAGVVRDELNVRRMRFVAAAEELGSYEVKANYRSLGPLFGKDMPLAAQAIAALDPAQVAAAIRDGGRIGIAVDGREHTLSAGDLILTMRAPEGYSVEREGAHAVALDLSLDEDLRREGYAREIVHAVQNARKTAGLQVEDRIELWLTGASALIEAAEAHREYISGETLATALNLRADGPGAEAEADRAAAGGYREQAEVDGLELSIALRRAEREAANRPSEGRGSS